MTKAQGWLVIGMLAMISSRQLDAAGEPYFAVAWMGLGVVAFLSAALIKPEGRINQ
jgi:hypothetical protein